jgi:hypothetical protein
VFPACNANASSFKKCNCNGGHQTNENLTTRFAFTCEPSTQLTTTNSISSSTMELPSFSLESFRYHWSSLYFWHYKFPLGIQFGVKAVLVAIFLKLTANHSTNEKKITQNYRILSFKTRAKSTSTFDHESGSPRPILVARIISQVFNIYFRRVI